MSRRRNAHGRLELELDALVTFHVLDGPPFLVTERLAFLADDDGQTLHGFGRVELRTDREATVYGYTVTVGDHSTGFREFDDRTPIRLLPSDTLGLTLHPEITGAVR